MAKRKLTIKYFKKGDKELSEILKNALGGVKKTLSLVETYKVYFHQDKTPKQLKGFDKKGEIVFLQNCLDPSSIPATKSSSTPVTEYYMYQSVFTYHKRNKTDKMTSNKDYHFIVCNKNGQVVEHENYGKAKWNYKYDSNNRLIKEIWDGSVSCEYKYDKKGRKISEIHYDMDDNSIDSIRKYYYNDMDKLLKKEFFQGGLYGQYLSSYSLFHYDKQSNLIKKEEFNVSTKIPNFREEYKYSKDGKLIEERGYRISKSKVIDEGKVKYIYENNRLKQEIGYRGNKSHGKTFYTYDSLGRLIKKEKFDGDGKLDSSDIWEYDKKKIAIDKKVLKTLPYFKGRYDVLVNNNRVLKEKMFYRLPDDISTVESITNYKYDKYGRLVQSTSKNP